MSDDDWYSEDRARLLEADEVRMRWHMQAAPMTHSLDAPLPYPHYSDSRWNTAQLIYGVECKTDECNYSDRLWRWNYAAAERATAACHEARLDTNTARWAAAWLSAYHEKPVIVRYIMAGANVSSGYPYWVYGYDYQREDE